MTTLNLTEEHKLKIREITSKFYPEVTEIQFTHGGLLRIKPKKRCQHAIHWFEFLFCFLAPKVATEYSQHNQTTTVKFAEFMVLQKLAHELKSSHPVDLLYDIWKNHKNYMAIL